MIKAKGYQYEINLHNNLNKFALNTIRNLINFFLFHRVFISIFILEVCYSCYSCMPHCYGETSQQLHSQVSSKLIILLTQLIKSAQSSDSRRHVCPDKAIKHDYFHTKVVKVSLHHKYFMCLKSTFFPYPT